LPGYALSSSPARATNRPRIIEANAVAGTGNAASRPQIVYGQTVHESKRTESVRANSVILTVTY
jgi:hypothetical protein